MPGYSKEARSNASIARSIKQLLGEGAYKAYKETGEYNVAALKTAREKKRSAKKPRPSASKPKKRVTPPPAGQLRRGTKIVSSNSKRPGRIEGTRTLKDGGKAYLVKWDDGHGMGVMTPDRLIVTEQAGGAPGKPDSTNAAPLYEKMSKRGIKVDTAGLSQAIDDGRALRDSRESELLALANAKGFRGDTFNPRRKADINELLRSMGRPEVQSPGEEALRAARVPDDVLSAILSVTRTRKTVQDLEVLERSVDSDGRLRPDWKEAATGRWYTGNPPIQTLSAAVREYLVPDEGNGFVTIDWHQHELRLLAKITGDPDLKAIFESDVDPHIAVYEKVTGNKTSDVPATRKRERDVGKMLNYALIYGLGPIGLAERLGIPEDRAIELIDRHFAEFPVMAKWIKSTRAQAKKDGYIETLEGRKIPIDIDDDGYMDARAERQAVNYTAQGSSADHLVDLLNRIYGEDENDIHVLATIHDALLLELPMDRSQELTKQYRDLMEQPFHGIAIPTDVKGPSSNWKASMDGVNIDIV